MATALLPDLVPLIPKLRAYALVLTKSASDADDLVQDTLLRAWRYRDGFAEGSNLKAWLFRILRNEFFNRLHAGRNTTEDVDGGYAAELVSPPEQEFNLRYQEVVAGLSRLSDDTREALLLTVGEGFTYAEAASACGCPVGTIASRVSRAREALADYIDLDRTSRPAAASAG